MHVGLPPIRALSLCRVRFATGKWLRQYESAENLLRHLGKRQVAVCYAVLILEIVSASNLARSLLVPEKARSGTDELAQWQTD